MKNSSPEILVEVLRDHFLESKHRGWIIISDRYGKIIARSGEGVPVTFVRSTLKPVQVLPLLLTEAADKFGFTDEEIALCISSHSGEPKHIELVKSMLEKIGMTQEDLKCGVHSPIYKKAAHDIYSRGEKPTKIHSNCSGKHTGMLAVCKINNWSIEDYFKPDHPLQKMIEECIEVMTDVKKDNLIISIDGCGVPVYSFSIMNLAICYARLCDPIDLPIKYREAVKRVVNIMKKYPYLIAGTERFDTDLILATNGNIISKAGGEGLNAIGILSKGWGMVVKIEDGNIRAVGPSVIEALKQMEIINEKEIESIKNWYHTPRYNYKNEFIGEIVPVFKLNICS